MELRLIVLSVAVLSCLVPPALGTWPVAETAALTAAKGAAVVGAGILAKKAIVGTGALVGAGLLAKKAVLAKGALVGGAVLAKKAAIAKGAIAAKKAVVVNGALVAKNVATGLAAHGAAVVAAKKAAIKAKTLGILAAKAAAVKGAVGLAAKGAAVGGAILNTKAAALNSLASVPVPYPYAVPHSVGYPSLVPVSVPVPSLQVAEAYAPGPQALLSRLAGLWGTIKDSVVAKGAAAVGNLVGSIGTRVVEPAPAYYDLTAPAAYYSVPVVDY